MKWNSICVFLAYAITAAVFIGSLWYDEIYILDPLSRKFGKWKFLTHWTLWIETTYWCLTVVAGLSTLITGHRDGLIHRVVDYVHASIAFPLGMAVCILFWMIYAVDRELVYPKRLDAIIPSWMNHVMHTSYLPLMVMDKYLTLHRYPRQSQGIPLLLFIPFLYQIWILYLALEHEIWVYPVLAVMNWPFRIAFFALTWAFFFLIYKAGERITVRLWGGQKKVKMQKLK